MMFDASTMQMLQAFNMYMKQQQALEKKEVLATKALQAIVSKIDQFDGRNVSKYLRFYTREMELSKVPEKEMIASFELAAMPELREQIKKLMERHGDTWEAFGRALKDEYFMEDTERVTKRSFLEWVARPKKGLSANELLREFDRQFSQLSRTEKLTLEAEKTELFLQAADSSLQEKLEPLLEDTTEERGLKTAWKDVEEAVSLLTKRQRRRDKIMVGNNTPIMGLAEARVEPAPKSSILARSSEDSSMEELVKGMRELRIKLARLEEKGQPSDTKPQHREGFIPRCMWCDSLDHARSACEEFKEAMRNNLVFFKEGRICSKESGLPIKTNFGRGGMKKTLDEMAASTAVATVEAAIYGAKVELVKHESLQNQLTYSKVPGEASELWPNAKRSIEKGKITSQDLS